MGVGDEVGRHAMEAASKTRAEGTKIVPIVLLDPPQAGGVKVVPETGYQKLIQNAGIVARMATEKVSAGRSVPI